MQAAILCGGSGDRLKPYTEKSAKSMIEVRGKPILLYQLEHMRNYGIDDVVLLCGHGADSIQSYFGDGRDFGVRLTYSIEREKLGTGGAVANARDKITGDFILVNGDIITNFPVSGLIGEFEKRKKPVLSVVRPFNLYGEIVTKDAGDGETFVEKFREKPRLDKPINAGYTAFPQSVLSKFPTVGDVEQLVYPQLEGREMYVFQIDDKYYWKGIDNFKDLKEAEELIAMSTISKN